MDKTPRTPRRGVLSFVHLVHLKSKSQDIGFAAGFVEGLKNLKWQLCWVYQLGREWAWFRLVMIIPTGRLGANRGRLSQRLCRRREWRT